jgi:hypothetical protein
MYAAVVLSASSVGLKTLIAIDVWAMVSRKFTDPSRARLRHAGGQREEGHLEHGEQARR